MLRWSIIFFILAILAAIFGFGDISEAATEIAQFLFFIFIVLLLVSVVIRLIKSK